VAVDTAEAADYSARMQGEWIQVVTLAVFVLFFLLVGIAALRKARKRRLEELRESREEELESKAAARQIAEEEREPAAPALAEEEEREGPAAPAVVERPLEAPDVALEAGLARTHESFIGRLNAIFGRHKQLDPEALLELEEALLTADVGVGLTTKLLGSLKAQRLESLAAVRTALKTQMMAAFSNGTGRQGDGLDGGGAKPRVILFVGVNGVGKTTTIGKVAARCKERGFSVVLGAGDTFRAAAVEQLTIWGDRVGARVIRGEPNSDPASVSFNAVEHGKQAGVDVVLLDTAGRLHTKTNLMDEIKKVKRSIGKARPGAPDETWLVVDATTGQNAVQQAKEFHSALGLTGVILTKLDGTAKGGVVVAIADALHLPVRFVGVGEKAQDLRPFDPTTFVNALLAP
jgi:fused signal recognition particle receptor